MRPFLCRLDSIRILRNDRAMKLLIAFLGNPGKQYEKTRHNYGWLLCDHFTAAIPDITWKEKFTSSTALWRFSSLHQGYLIKPGEFMNRSGNAVSRAASFYSLSPGQIVVVHDDLETPFGTVSLKKGGGLGGHNGLRSIAGQLGSRDFLRLKLGIGRPGRQEVSSYVLSRFSPIEEAQLPDICEAASLMLQDVFDSPVKEIKRRVY